METLLGLFLEAREWWPTLNEAEIPEFPYQMVQEQIKGLRKLDILKWMLCDERRHIKCFPHTDNAQRTHPECAGERVPRITENCSDDLLCKPELMVGEVGTGLSPLIEMRMMGPGSNRGQVDAINHWKSRGGNYAKNQGGFICWMSWRWLITYNILRNKIETK